MKLTHDIYNHYKLTTNELYNNYFNSLCENIRKNEDNCMMLTYDKKDMVEEEQEALTLDIMLSNVLGTVTSFDRTHALATMTTEQIAVIRLALDTLAQEAHNNPTFHDNDILQTITQLENII